MMIALIMPRTLKIWTPFLELHNGQEKKEMRFNVSESLMDAKNTDIYEYRETNSLAAAAKYLVAQFVVIGCCGGDERRGINHCLLRLCR